MLVLLIYNNTLIISYIGILGYNIIMNKFKHLIEGVLFTLCLLGMMYVMLNNGKISELYGFPFYFLPGISFAIIVYIGYRYIKLYVSAHRLEREFTSVVNHTFRTPLTSINWYTGEMGRDISDTERLLYIQNINNATNKLLGIVDMFAGIKDINNVSGYFFEATSLREIVEKSINKYRGDITKKNITFQVPTFKDVPLLTIDLKKITFVIDALLENAIMYTPKDGKILIECISKSNKLTLYIADTGMGLGMMDRMKVFSKFYRSKRAVLANPDGMGLRLYLSRKIVERHKGKLYAKSKGEDKGTTFFLELPFLNRKNN